MRLKTLATLAVPIAAMIVILALSRSDVSAQLKFAPALTVCAENLDTPNVQCDGDTSAGSPADISINFSIGLGPDGTPGTDDDTDDANFIALVNFLNQEFVVPGADLQTGALVGQITTTPTLGLLNQPCNTQLPISVDMIAASTDTTDTIPDEPEIPDPDWPGFADADGNSLQDAVDRYPAFLNTIFPDLTPVSRSIGIQNIAGQNVVIQLLTFPAGSDFPVLAPDHPPFNEELGLPMVTVLQNPLAPPAPQSITDFCAPLQSNIISFAVSVDNPATADVEEGGVPLLINPEASSYTFTSWARTPRDADGDGFEQGDVTGIDTCPLQANRGDPKVTGDGDADEDGLDAACDPDDNDKNSDQDDDSFSNRQDNCTLIANPDQEDSDQDGIGDACDIAGAEIIFPDDSTASLQGPDTPDGDMVELFVESELVIAPAGDDGGFPLWAAILAGVGGGALLLATAGTVLIMRRRS